MINRPQIGPKRLAILLIFLKKIFSINIQVHKRFYRGLIIRLARTRPLISIANASTDNSYRSKINAKRK